MLMTTRYFFDALRQLSTSNVPGLPGTGLIPVYFDALAIFPASFCSTSGGTGPVHVDASC